MNLIDNCELYIQGVIFDTQFDNISSTIFSVSDDRTCKIWRQNVTGNPNENVATSKGLPYECVGTVYGHKARIWKCIPYMIKGAFFTIGEVSNI